MIGIPRSLIFKLYGENMRILMFKPRLDMDVKIFNHKSNITVFPHIILPQHIIANS